ncbi:hypothetical protein BGZ60DRAFT_421881 [Tricladium varicosporioides]|nr:hypothetical protein BGZ60DRAFT_421881 [Hymenoscyphus varicosporioides]
MRLENLERRVKPSSASPHQMHEELHRQQDWKESTKKDEENTGIIHRQPSPTALQGQGTKQMEVSQPAEVSFEGGGSGTYHLGRQEPHHPDFTEGGQFGGFRMPFPAILPSAVLFHGAVEQKGRLLNMCQSYTSHAYEDLNHVGTILTQLKFQL